ncbi:unnamed protein product [Urochloa decumbens]|uniref:Uncharacterized protein n=1 Tax=Urochloa decumbens TaxID=240449 RepID=A0ABC8WQE3_9POAL
MFPDDDAKLRGGVAGRATRTKASGGEQPRSAVAVVAGGGGQRGTLYDSFELNAMVVRLNRLLNGDGAGRGEEARRRPRKAAGSWLAAPKVLFRRIKGALLGGRRGDG